MKTDDILALYDLEERFNARWLLLEREELPHLVRHVPVSPEAGNTAVLGYSSLDEFTADAAIAEQVAWAASRGLMLSWKLYAHDTPRDLAERLIARGLEPQEPESIMVLDLERAPAALREPTVLDVRRLSDPALVAHVKEVNGAVWGEEKPELYAELAHTMEHRPEELSVYVAYCDHKPVASAWLRIREGKPFASLWGGSTLPAHRKRGYYTALLAVRVQEAARRGARFLTVDAGPMSRPIVAGHGFREITTARDYDTPRRV